MWTAASGAIAQAQNLDVIANNLANADTLAYKKDTPTFKEYLAVVEREHPTADIPRGPIKDSEFYPIDGRDQAFVTLDGTHINFRQGGVRVTHHPLDLALQGPGFLEVSTPSGIRYSRAGNLKVISDGRLVTSEGYPVLAIQPVNPLNPLAPVNDPAARHIYLRDRSKNLMISSRGEISSGEDPVAQLSLVEFQDPRKLRKAGENLYQDKGAKPGPAEFTVLQQGMLETSNVNPVEEMVNMIKANRLFEHDMKSLKTYGDLLGKEANEVGKL